MAITDSTRICGVYKISCSGNNKFYIGSSVSIKARWSAHKSMLRNNKHGNKHLQNAWNKHGADSFSFSIIEKCSDESVTEKEQYWIDCTGCHISEIGMNNSPTASTTIGFKHSEASKKKLSELAASHDHTHLRIANEKRRGMPGHSKGKPGKKWSDEMRSAASISRKGMKAWNKGIPHSDEVRERIAVSTSLALRTIPEAKRNEIKVLRASGMSYPKISAQLGISISQCHKIFNNVRGQYKSIGSLRTLEKVKGVAK